MSYAEAAIDGQSVICAATATHVADCPQCEAEVSQIQTSLSSLDTARELQPTRQFTAKILLASQHERRLMEQSHRRRAAVITTGKVTVLATVVTVVAWAAVQSAGDADATVSAQPASVQAALLADFLNSDHVRQAAYEVQTLGPAVLARTSPRTYTEWAKLRAVKNLDRGLSDALAALEQNPRSVRAGQMVYSNLQQQAEALRSLYIERAN